LITNPLSSTAFLFSPDFGAFVVIGLGGRTTESLMGDLEKLNSRVASATRDEEI